MTAIRQIVSEICESQKELHDAMVKYQHTMTAIRQIEKYEMLADMLFGRQEISIAGILGAIDAAHGKMIGDAIRHELALTAAERDKLREQVKSYIGIVDKLERQQDELLAACKGVEAFLARLTAEGALDMLSDYYSPKEINDPCEGLHAAIAKVEASR